MNHEEIKKASLIIAMLANFITPFMGSSINIALPKIAEELQINAILLSWIATSYLLSVAITLVPFGRLADIYGRKKIFMIGTIVFMVFSICSAISTSAPMLIFFRVFQGMGSSMIFATGIAIITSVFPPQERGKAMGLCVASVYVGLSAGPFLGGFLTQHLTWRSVFFVNAPICLVIITLVLKKIKGDWAEAKGEKFDLFGSVIYAATIISVAISLLPSMRHLWPVLIILGGAGFIAFVKWETRINSPVFELSLFRTNRIFAFSCLAALINYSATFAVTFLISLYLQHIKGLNPQSAGLIMISQPLVMVVCAPIAGRLSDKIEPRIVATFGMIATSISLVLFILITKDTTLPGIMFRLAVLGFGIALFSSPNTNAIMSSVEKRFYGIASGSMGTMRTLGMMISMAIATLIFSIFIGKVQITPEHYPAFMKSIRIAFIVFSIFCTGGVFSSFVRGKLRDENSNTSD
ncbi:MFS transporter [Thermodesulfobacteriota bacterium]